MTPYYIFYTVFFIGSAFIYGNKGTYLQKNTRVGILGFSLAFLILALRHPYMGFDLGYGTYQGYLPSFYMINSFNLENVITMDKFLNYERGYILFNKIVGLIYKNEQFFLIVCAFVSLLPVAIYICKRTNITLLSVCIFVALPVFLIFYSGLRQGIAIGITAFSMYFIENKKKILFILTVLLASTFHSSSLVFLIAYPLYHIKYNDFGKLLLLFLLPIVFILRGTLFSLLSKLFKEDAMIESTGAGTLFFIFVCIYAFLVFFNDSKDKNQNGLINLCYVACICQAFSGIYSTAMRVGYYFMVYMAVAIPNTMDNFKYIKIKYNSYHTLIKFAILVVFLFYGLYAFRNGGWARSCPYIYFWQY